MASAFSFAFYLEGVIPRCADAVIGRNLLERRGVGKGREPAPDAIARDRAARARRGQILVRLADQDVCASCPCIAGGQYDAPGQLVLNIQVELLNRTLPEIAVHGLNRSGIIRRADRT